MTTPTKFQLARIAATLMSTEHLTYKEAVGRALTLLDESESAISEVVNRTSAHSKAKAKDAELTKQFVELCTEAHRLLKHGPFRDGGRANAAWVKKYEELSAKKQELASAQWFVASFGGDLNDD